MVATGPLTNHRILITRGNSQATNMLEKIEFLGGTGLTIPLLDFILPRHQPDIKKQLLTLNTYDWLILTSQNGVEFFFQLLAEMGTTWSLPKIAVIGKKTEAELKKHGIKADFVPTDFVAEVFVVEFIPKLKKGSRVLVAKGNLARTVIADNIRQAGAECKELIVYETVSPKESEHHLVQVLETAAVDVLTFTSSSTVTYFMETVQKYQLEEKLKGLIIACIGPIAKKTAEEQGLQVHVCPDIYTVDAMLEKLSTYVLSKSHDLEE